MSNLRRERRGSRSFTTIDNEFVRRSDLSWEARGLLTYLLSLPEEWQIRMTHLEKQSPAGRDQLRRIVRELEGAGYIERRARHDGKRLSGWDFYFDELPVADRLETSPTGNQSDGKPATKNKRLLASKENNQGASPEVEALPPAKGKTPSSAPSDLSILKERSLEVYSEVRAENWIDHKKPPRDADPQLREALAYSDGDVEAAVAVVRDALAFAASDTWWTDPNKTLSMANILAKGRVTTFAEKQRALSHSDAAASVALYDLTTGNPVEKVKEISERVSHTRDATEEEWRWADDASKGRFIRPGRCYHVTHVGPPGSPGYVGMAEVLRIEQIYATIHTPDGQEFRTHVSNLGRESYDRRGVSREPKPDAVNGDIPPGGGEPELGAEPPGGSREQAAGPAASGRGTTGDGGSGAELSEVDDLRLREEGGSGLRTGNAGAEGGVVGRSDLPRGDSVSGGASAESGGRRRQAEGGESAHRPGSGGARQPGGAAGVDDGSGTGVGSGMGAAEVATTADERRHGVEHAERQPDSRNRPGNEHANLSEPGESDLLSGMDRRGDAKDVGRGVREGSGEGGGTDRAADIGDIRTNKPLPRPGDFLPGRANTTPREDS